MTGESRRGAGDGGILAITVLTHSPDSKELEPRGGPAPGALARVPKSRATDRMIPRLNTRLPLFEVGLLVVVVALGWGAFHCYDALNRLKPPPAQVAVPAPPEAQDIQEILKLHSLLEMKERYAALAERLDSSLFELRDALSNFVRDKDPTEIGRYLRQSDALGAWLNKQQENLDGRAQQALRDWLATLPAAQQPAGSNSVVLNLDQLLGGALVSYSNYLAAAALREGQPLTSELVQKKLGKAAEHEQALARIGQQAAEQAGAIERFVARHPGELVARPVVAADGGGGGVSAFVEEAQLLLQPLFYLLVVTLIVQCALLIVALYGRIIVAPLRQRLIEDNTAVEHQKKLDHFARLATGLAHEIRNPLTAINVRLFTLQKSMQQGTSEDSDASLIRNEIDRLEQILKNFLKLARPSEPKFTALTAEPTLREVCDLLGPQLQRQGIELNLDSVVDARFQADPLQLKQVLINLIQNAADSIGRHGVITLRARRESAALENGPGDAVVLEVQDTGTGITPEVQERLFDPFFSTKESGTGLGLPIAAKIIDQHKGVLDFETRPGYGTTFRVALPVMTA